MRLWSIHPGYLDAKGLVALWREGLLAQHVLLGKTKGYKNHPQLIRFKAAENPAGAIADYLRSVADEADQRGYHFDRNKIINEELRGLITVTTGQVAYELNHLLEKLRRRDPERYTRLCTITEIKLHPIFNQVDGAREAWEIVTVLQR
ncbi:pyrimidine dimer DNA glycosylase/endonuclease V [Nitrosomonas sp.]|uniref:pyrimidine dimer DNA glycosylase/endonuclease V n=1 Tax=Nitrosomonas sp. TaxID=42353 RepID=UPI00263786DC|nr:pyrimidine dimer DNA glycosylase/endonuclease V [Nitrosomonas sp.]